MEEANSSRSAAADTNEPVIKERLVFSVAGNIISSNKNQFMGRALDLLKAHVGLNYNRWKEVPAPKKTIIWNALEKQYDIPSIRKPKIMRKMAIQVCTWKKNLREKYFKGLTAADIRKLRDSPPEDEGIPKTAWMKFIDRESSEEKMKEREKNKANRRKKTDVHCSGRLSYDEVEQRLIKEGKPHTRTDVYIELRKQKKKNGDIHPKAVGIVEKVRGVQKSQLEQNFTPMLLDEDPLGQVCGPESRGRVRGKGSVTSKTELDHLNSVQPKLDEFAAQNTDIQEMKGSISELKGTVNSLAELVKTMVGDKGSNNIASTSGTPQTRDSVTPTPLAANKTTRRLASQFGTPQTHDSNMPLLSSPIGHMPQSRKLERYFLYGFSNSNPIAMGEASPEPTPGTLVHHRPLTEHERRVSIQKVMEGMENEPLYLHSQGGATTIGDLVGAFVVWPFGLMRLANI